MTSAAVAKERKAAAIERGPNPYKAERPASAKCINCGRGMATPKGVSVSVALCASCITRAKMIRAEKAAAK